MYAIAEQLDYPTSEIGIYIQPIHQGASCHIDFALPYNPNNYWEVYRMKELYIKASEALLKQGAYFSRPYGKWAEMAFNRDVQTTTVLRKIKNIFDPNNIMNTGKLCF
jgi:FAD/FMN-containing dehydrogenase